MEKFKIILIFVFIAALSTSAYALFSLVNSFYGMNDIDYLTIVKNTNTTIYFSAPMHGDFKNITLQITANSNISMSSKSIIVTTSPNVLYCLGWQPAANCTNATDNNFISYAEHLGGLGWMYLNYTKPALLLNYSYQIKVQDNSFFNATYNAQCFNQTILQFSAQSHGSGSNHYCWNGTAWYTLANLNGPNNQRIQDLRIYLFLNTSLPSNPYLYIGTPGSHFDWNYTGQFDGNSNVSVNVTKINEILNNNCSCTNCNINNNNCHIPFMFASETNTTLELQFLNSTYEYGVDKCSIAPFTYPILNMTYYNEETSIPITASNNYNLDVTQPFTQLIAGEYGSGLTHSFCTNVNLSKRNINYNIDGTMTVSSPNYETKIVENDNTSPYVVATTPPYSLPLYLVNVGNDSTVIFKTKDSITKEILAGVYVRMYQYVNGTPLLVNYKISGVTGEAVFNYIANKQYLVNFSFTGYNHLAANFNPITSSSYDILMTKTTQQEAIAPFGRITIETLPSVYEIGSNIYTVRFTSPYDEFIYYSYNISYPNSHVYDIGYLDGGQTFTGLVNISTVATLRDKVKLIVVYNTELTGVQTFVYYYDINVEPSNYSMMNNKGQQYGLGLFERLLIVVFIAILFAGIATMMGQVEAGMFLAFIIMGIFTYLEFFPIWAMLISVFIAVIVIGGRAN